MSYGKYGVKIKTPYYDINMSPQYNLGMAIGDALGNLWGDNYNRRGVEKAQQAGDEALQQAKEAMNRPQDYTSANEALNTVLTNYAEGNNRNQGWEQMPGLPAATNQQSAQQLQGWDNDGQKWNVMQGVTPERAASQAVVPDLSFRKDDFKADFFRQQRAAGRPEHQIEQAWSNMEPQVSVLDTQAKTLRSNNVIEQLARMAPTMDNAERIKLINSLAQDNPEMAKIFLQDTITNRDIWNVQRQEQKAQNAANAKATQKQAAFNEREMYGRRYGLTGDALRHYVLTGNLPRNGTGSGRTGSKSIWEDKGFQQYVELRNRIDNQEPLSNTEIALFNALDEQYKPYLSGQQAEREASTTAVWNDWNNVAQGIQNDLQNGATQEQILQNAQNLVQSGQMPKEFLTKIQESFSNNSRQPQVITPVEDETPLFPDWGNNGSRSGIAAMTGDEAAATALDYLTGKKNFGLAHR